MASQEISCHSEGILDISKSDSHNAYINFKSEKLGGEKDPFYSDFLSGRNVGGQVLSTVFTDAITYRLDPCFLVENLEFYFP